MKPSCPRARSSLSRPPAIAEPPMEGRVSPSREGSNRQGAPIGSLRQSPRAAFPDLWNAARPGMAACGNHHERHQKSCDEKPQRKFGRRWPGTSAFHDMPPPGWEQVHANALVPAPGKLCLRSADKVLQAHETDCGGSGNQIASAAFLSRCCRCQVNADSSCRRRTPHFDGC